MTHAKFSRGLVPLSILSVVLVVGGFAMVFFYAPNEADQGFVQKIFYLHVPLAIVALQLVAVPAFTILLLEPSPGPGLLELIGMLLLADAGIAVVGTLVGALAIQTRARDLIVPLIALPLLLPVVIGTTKALAPAFAAGGPGALPGRWLAILGLYDLVFGLLAYAVFDFLLED